MMDVAGLNDAGHGARRILRIGHFEARLVAVRIERLAERFDPLHAMLGEGVEKPASRRLDSGEKRVDDRIGSLVAGDAGDRTLEVVDRRQKVAGKSRGGVSNGLVAITPRLIADILLLGERPQQAIPGCRQFSRQFAG
jgi:hypothetical protein